MRENVFFEGVNCVFDQKPLKSVQKILNEVLQYHYYYRYKPANIHGFVVRPKGELKMCNIVSNAKTHVGKKYVLNIDLKDFFASILQSRFISCFCLSVLSLTTTSLKA